MIGNNAPVGPMWTAGNRPDADEADRLTSSRTPVPSFAAGFTTQMRVVGSLLLRELNERFGRENVGYLWMIGEPLLLASVITLIHLGQPSNHFSSDITPAPFAILGYTVYIIFRGVVNKSESLVESGRELFFHRTVSILDIVVARTIVESVGAIGALIILMGIAILTGLADFPVRPFYMLGGIAMMIWWSMALSMIVVRITYKNHLVGRQVHVFTYFCIPVSGAFFQMSQIPSQFSDVLRWWPMTLIFEQVRYGQFQFAGRRFVDPGYVCAVCAVLTYVGLVLIRRLRTRL